jgi:hypothetical protein
LEHVCEERQQSQYILNILKKKVMVQHAKEGDYMSILNIFHIRALAIVRIFVFNFSGNRI